MDRTTKKLFKRKNVVMVLVPGPGKEGKKYTLGLDTGRDAVIVGVIKKMPLSQLAKKDRVPAKVKGVETDVWEVGKIELQKARTDKWRPALGGVAIGHKDITYGTLTGAFKKHGVKYGMSCNHVLANCNKAVIGDDIMQPGPYAVTPEMGDCRHGKLAEFIWMNKISLDPSTCSLSHGVAKFLNLWPWFFHRKTRWMPVIEQFETNLVDIALYKPNSPDDLLDTILGEDGESIKITGAVESHVEMKVRKFGARTGVAPGEATAVGASINVALNAEMTEFAIFEDQVMTTPMSEGGDSGAAVLDMENNIAGVLFAGSTQATIYQKWSNVVKELELDQIGG